MSTEKGKERRDLIKKTGLFTAASAATLVLGSKLLPTTHEPITSSVTQAYQAAKQTLVSSSSSGGSSDPTFDANGIQFPDLASDPAFRSSSMFWRSDLQQVRASDNRSSSFVSIIRSPATVVSPAGPDMFGDFGVNTPGATATCGIQAAMNSLSATGGLVHVKSGTYPMTANLTGVSNVSLELEPGVVFTWSGSNGFQINGKSNIAVTCLGGTGYYSTTLFPVQIDNTTGNVESIHIERLRTTPITLINAGNATYAFDQVMFVECFTNNNISVQGTTTIELPESVYFERCFHELSIASQALLTIQAGSCLGQTFFNGCTFDFEANSTAILNILTSSSGHNTSVHVMNSNITIAAGLTGLCFCESLNTGASWIYDFTMNGAYIEDHSPFTCLYEPMAGGGIVGNFSFLNLTTTGGNSTGDTLINVNFFSNYSYVTFFNLEQPASGVHPWLLGSVSPAYAPTIGGVYIDRVYGITGAAAFTPSLPGTGVAYPTLYYDATYVVTTATGLTGLAVQGVAVSIIIGIPIPVTANQVIVPTYTGGSLVIKVIPK